MKAERETKGKARMKDVRSQREPEEYKEEDTRYRGDRDRKRRGYNHSLRDDETYEDDRRRRARIEEEEEEYLASAAP